MRLDYRSIVRAALAVTLASGLPALGAETEIDALDLKSAPVEPERSAASLPKFFIEGALGATDRRDAPGSESLRRISADLFYATRLGPNWRAVVSDRLDHVRPPMAGSTDTLNSLRELYAGWDADDGRVAVDLGRINWRQGPAYGFNPTDFFRDGALRVVTTANPFSLRENRLGVVMLRGQRTWQGGSISVALAPELADSASNDAWSVDLGATNNRHRALLSATQQLSERVNTQVLVYKEPHLDAQIGASMTALVGDALVTHAEWAYSREPALIDRALSRSAPLVSGHRFAGGATYTTSSELSLTLEYQYNRFALSQAQWDRVNASTPLLLGAYLLQAQRLQDAPSREGVLLYLSQASVGTKNLDATAYVRLDVHDHSRMSWLELRYHWDAVDVALQWQVFSGRASSVFGFSPSRQTAQLLAAYHFR